MIEELSLSDCKVSHYYEAEPWGELNQEWFINIALTAYCDFEPDNILKIIKDIEIKVGRQKRERWKEREIDIDIILYGALIYKSEILEIPHPNFLNRAFVLKPLAELIPDFYITKHNIDVQSACEQCKDKSITRPIEIYTI